MKLNESSNSAKLYRWYYSETDMPANLCPYFWKLVQMYLLIIPFVIISLPQLITDNFKIERNSKVTSSATGVMMWFFLYVCFSILMIPTYYFHVKNEFIHASSILGHLVLSVVILFGLQHLTKIIYEKIKHKKFDKRTFKEDKPNIIIEFVKAKYNKYCPQITWYKDKI